ncbi:hypothetical protein AB1Y20_022476 [Prymnesium parvum]|uniref:Uncharacterized protein n=1 Tax=Prymnesium parvum TaxID=97485 RepID=A0AB34JHP1_PRYPA
MICPSDPLSSPRATEPLQAAQLRLNHRFTHLIHAPSTAPPSALTELEACRLSNSERERAPILPSDRARSLTAVLQQQIAFAKAISAGCPASSLPPHCSIGDWPSCAYQEGLPLHLRQPLLRYAAFAPVGEPSHLVVALRLLSARNHTLLVVGESTAGEVVRHGHCELARHNASSLRPRIELAQPHGQVRPEDVIEARLRALNASLEQVISAGGGMVLLSVGVHFNFPDREKYVAYLRQVLPALDRFARRCRKCISLVRTPNVQHFPSTGAVGTSTFQMSSAKFSSAYPCKALRTRNFSTKTGHSTAELLPECWRTADRTRTIDELGLRHVLIADYGRAMERFWQSHPGNMIKDKSTGNSTGVSDCSHNCMSAFLYEPLWWAVRFVASLYDEYTNISGKAGS